MKKTILALMTTIMLVGCAGPLVFRKSGADQSDYNRDVSACRYDAVKYGHVPMWGTGVGAGIEQAMREREILVSCMTSKGWSSGQ